MIRKFSRFCFGFIKGQQSRFSKQKNQNWVQSLKSNYLTMAQNIDFKSLKKIDLSKLNIKYEEDTTDLKTVPQLKHGLDKYLTGELVFGDSGVGNLPRNIENLSEEIIQKMSNYKPPQQDKALQNRNISHNCKYISSTSNISSPLMALFFIFSCFRTPNFDYILPNLPINNYMVSFRKPCTFFLSPLETGQRAIVNDQGVLGISNLVLLKLGHVIEYFLLHEKEETQAIMSGKTEETVPNYYRYANVNDQIFLRSQIDCRSVDKNGNDYIFQIKSRACAPIRYDIENYQDYKDYEINKKRGSLESFEREYMDLIRGGFLKYAMQIKIGKMDGAFIAYHNTQKIYGYQYVQLKEMALRLFGDEYNLDVSFIVISKMLTIVLDEIRAKLPQFKDDQLKVGFYANCQVKKLVVMVEPLTIVKKYEREPQIDSIFEYFKKHPLQNPVYKFNFTFHTFLNGQLFDNSDVLFTQDDSIEMKWAVTPKTRVATTDYLNFLYQAYKSDQIAGSYKYRGLWMHI